MALLLIIQGKSSLVGPLVAPVFSFAAIYSHDGDHARVSQSGANDSEQICGRHIHGAFRFWSLDFAPEKPRRESITPRKRGIDSAAASRWQTRSRC
ncbi:hypothetical protein [Bradyrhizobium sp.]|uniref:hypothetical protein n=1 Tax=Bradyrhizobium sp. TaxID=376 RepID=UPI00262558D0|nr:hypothetical protein [Bradyrhizobium sp.]